MFATAFDLDTAQTRLNHPKGVSQANADIRHLLATFEFDWTQGSLYTTDREDLGRLFAATQALKTLDWFPDSVRDICAFRVEQWSDFTAFMKQP